MKKSVKTFKAYIHISCLYLLPINTNGAIVL